MKRALKKKLNLTIEEPLLDKAKQVAEARGESLSQLVESFLAQLVAESTDRTGHWLEQFHKRYLTRTSREPTDEELAKLLDDR